MNARETKDQVYEWVATIGKAASSPKRLEILDILCQGEKSVEILARQANLNVKLASAHLKVLKAARLVEYRRVGKNIYYTLAGDEVARFWVGLRRLAELRFLEIEKTLNEYFGDRDSLLEMDRKTLLSRAKNGDVIIIDVRPSNEFEAGHLPYAKSIPLSELKKRLKEVPKNKPIVAYCRGPYCVLSHEAMELLRKRGRKVSRLSDGVSEWAAFGLPVEKGVA